MVSKRRNKYYVKTLCVCGQIPNSNFADQIRSESIQILIDVPRILVAIILEY